MNFNSADVSSEPYSGTVQISAKDYSGAATPTFTLDGETLDSAAAMERGAYFVFDYTGVDSYFKNGLTTGGDTEATGTIIGTFSKCSTIPLTVVWPCLWDSSTSSTMVRAARPLN